MMSNLERVVYKILVKNNIKFIQEKVFKDLRNGLYRFDFYLPNDEVCIEVNGAQHYQFNKLFYKKRSDFTKAQERDRRKISYCLAHGIKLYCIPYWDIESIVGLDDVFQDRFIATSKFHNDIVWREKRREKK